MYKAYFASDSSANTGPAIVNMYYKKYLNSNEYHFSKTYNNKVLRLINDIRNIFRSKVVVFSGASMADIIYMRICKMLKKKMIYIMHGCIQEENKINRVENEKETKLELRYLKNVDLVLGVSQHFVEWVKQYYPQVIGKIQSLPNGVDMNMDFSPEEDRERDSLTIAIVGGGIPRKNVLVICEALEEIRKETGKTYTLKVFGRDEVYTPQIKQFSFVEYYGKIPRDEMFSELRTAHLFIQNSVFESFGMAPIEALMLGCNVLCSNNVGSLSIIETIEETDVIKDCSDIQEIKGKIQYNMQHRNNKRLIDGLDKDKTSFRNRARELEEYIQGLL